MRGKDDDELMVMLQGGNVLAFAELVDRHQRPLTCFLQSSLRDWQLSEDLCQECLWRVHQNASEYVPAGSFKSWLFRIARNLLIDTARRSKHDAICQRESNYFDDGSDSLVELPSGVVGPSEEAERRELSDLVDSILPDIPAEQRTAFVLFVFGRLSLPEIASLMESSLPTTKGRMRLAREKMRELLPSSVTMQVA